MRATIRAVTREGALRIADEYLKGSPRPNCEGIERVFTIPELEEFMIRRPCIYGLPSETLRRCWIAYAKRPSSYCMVASSDIIVVAQETGEVVFFGAAKRRGVTVCILKSAYSPLLRH
jgi:hypothetical protein